MGRLLKRTRERPQCDRKPDAFEAEREALGGWPVRQEQTKRILITALRCECPKVGAGSVTGFLAVHPAGMGRTGWRPPRRAMLDTEMSCGAPA